MIVNLNQAKHLVNLIMYYPKGTSSKRCIGLICLLLLQAGCALKHDPKFAPTRPHSTALPVPNTGAIYQTGNEIRLFEDQIARRVGDVLTITLVENTSVVQNNDMDLKKDSQITADAPTVFGQLDPKVLGLSLEQNIQFNRTMSGKNKGKQDNNLNGTVSVTVTDVLANGNLLVRGEKRLGMTGGNEYVKISGIVRRIDIDVANTVPSTKVADATIEYSADGQMADASKQGWLARFFYSPWFPF